jgi:hypothetical protein
MTITLRIDKGSALSHDELDGNFTDLDGRVTTLQTDVAAIPDVTDGTENLDVSSIIVRSSLSAIGTQYNSNTLERIAGTGEGATDVISCLFRSDYSVNSHNLQDNQSAGMFAWIVTADKSDVLGGGVKWITDNVTDTNNFNTLVQLTCYDTVGGSRSEAIYTLEPKKAVFPNSLQLTPTAYADLPDNPDYTTNGMIAFLSTDGASANQYKPIYSVNGVWNYFDDNSAVASS